MEDFGKAIKYNFKNDKPDYQFQKYGMVFLSDGSVRGPKKPEYYSKTPKFNYENPKRRLLEEEKYFLINKFQNPFSVKKNQEQIFSIANKIVQTVAGRPLSDYAHIIVMPHEDFGKFREKIRDRMKKERGVSGDFHGINMQGLVILEDSGGSNCFPMLFHEVGHSLYPDEDDNYTDEFRAFYFQIVCTKLLEKELEKIGLGFTYPEDYYKSIPLPTEEHEKAFKNARLLYTLQISYEYFVKGDEKLENMQKEFLEIVKQNERGISG